MTRLIYILLLFPLLSKSQARVDDESPKIKLISSLSAYTGWTKNDIGKWHSFPNGLISYDHNDVPPRNICETLIKIECADISYRNKSYKCIAEFKKHHYIRHGITYTEYPIEYWLVDLSRHDTLIGNDTTVMAILYNTVHTGMISGPTMAHWGKIGEDIAANLDNPDALKSSFCIQMRQDAKHKMCQFLLGSYIDELQQFQPTFCSVPGDNNELANLYYELPSSTFMNFMTQLNH